MYSILQAAFVLNNSQHSTVLTTVMYIYTTTLHLCNYCTKKCLQFNHV